MNPIIKILCKEVIIPIIVAVCVEFCLDHFRKKKARIHLRSKNNLTQSKNKSKIVPVS